MYRTNYIHFHTLYIPVELVSKISAKVKHSLEKAHFVSDSACCSETKLCENIVLDIKLMLMTLAPHSYPFIPLQFACRMRYIIFVIHDHHNKCLIFHITSKSKM